MATCVGHSNELESLYTFVDTTLMGSQAYEKSLQGVHKKEMAIIKISKHMKTIRFFIGNYLVPP